MERRFSIIVPALNEARYIRACLTSLAALETTGPRFEIILADNGSTDGTQDIAREIGVRVVSNSDVNIGGLRNHGFKYASGDRIAFLDADCTVLPSWLSCAASSMEATGAAIVGSVHRAPIDAGWIALASTELTMTKVGRVNYIPSGNLIVSRECFERVGGFDERMRTNEDVDFCRRARHLGYAVFSDRAIVAFHHGVPRSTLDLFRRELWHGRDSFRVFLNDLKQVTNLWVVLYSFTFAFVALLGLVAGGVSALTRSVWPLMLYAALLLGLVGLVWTTRARPHQKHRLPILVHQLVYGTARAASLAVAIAGLFRSSAHGRGSWRVSRTEPDSQSQSEH